MTDTALAAVQALGGAAAKWPAPSEGEAAALKAATARLSLEDIWRDNFEPLVETLEQLSLAYHHQPGASHGPPFSECDHPHCERNGALLATIKREATEAQR